MLQKLDLKLVSLDADLFVKKNIELLKVRKRNFIVYRALDHGGRVFQLQTKNRS